jgi:hypothetical protein
MILLELSFIMDKRKKGIALFITLLVIASILSIVAVSFSYLEKVQKDAGATSAIIQGNLLYKNTITVLKRFFPAGEGNIDKLSLIYSMPLMLTEGKSGFMLNLECKPLMIGVPIAWIDPELTKNAPEKKTLAQEVLNSIMDLYEIKEPNHLDELIYQEVTGKRPRNNEYEPRLEQKKGIISKQQFGRILLDYRLRYDDANVYKVPWERYFNFTETDERSTIDGSYLSPELISIAFDIPIEIVQDGWIPEEMSLSQFLQENGISTPVNKKLYSAKALNAMHCEQTYAYKEGHYKFNFDYINGRSANFELDGQQ